MTAGSSGRRIIAVQKRDQQDRLSERRCRLSQCFMLQRQCLLTGFIYTMIFTITACYHHLRPAVIITRSSFSDQTGYWSRFYVPLNTKYVISVTFPKPISWLGMEKQNLTQQKHAFRNQKKCTSTQNKHKKLKPGLVASYDIQPGNEVGTFWFQCFINLLLTYLLRHSLTAPNHTGPVINSTTELHRDHNKQPSQQ